MKHIIPSESSVPEVQRLLQGGIGPRPIALVSTVSKEGINNLSPFSFYNVFGANPPVIAFSPSRRGRDGTLKDTYLNLIETKECVVQAVTYSMVEQVSLASTEYERGIDEFVKSGLTPIDSDLVKPKRVKESPFQMECRLLDMMSYGDGGASANIAICEVIKFHVDELVFVNGIIYPNKIDLVARMSGDFYCRAFGDNIFEVEKPILKKGIGFDQIPDFIKKSDIYSANNLGKLGNIEIIPSEKAVTNYIERVKQNTENEPDYSLALFEDFQNKKNFVKMLQIVLVNSSLSPSNKKQLLEKTAKVALESNQTEAAWKIALFAGREKMSDEKLPIWIPSDDRINSSNVKKYLSFLSSNYRKTFSNYSEQYNWSVTEIEEFWKSIWEYSKIVHSKTYSLVLSKRILPGAVWFKDSELNFAENLLRYNDDVVAIISIRENHPTIRLTYKELYVLVAHCAAGLQNLGVKKGDRVAGFVTNYPESVIAMLAVTSLGAIWSSTSPDFGFDGVYDRFSQIEPKILFATELYNYAGKKINCLEKIEKLSSQIPSIEKVVLIDEFNDLKNKETNSNHIKSPNFIKFNDLLDNTSTYITFKQVPFDHPVYIMYSSGTTGKPKCIVHGAGGTLLQHFKELHLHTDLKREDKIAYYTTCGWMMWNWLVSGLQLGASVVLIDGSPVYPDNEILWKKIEEECITIFGTSPKYLSSIEKSGLVPKEKFSLSKLKTILSTGSPLSEENFKWVYKNVKSDLQLSSISGGTDIISCFILGCPILPVYSGEIQCRGLGMKVESYDDNGNSLVDEKGELICAEPFPSSPIYFWNDSDNQKYKKAYFERFPNVWHHGDFIKITKTGGVVVYGRSDATLNPGGVRIGTAEIYRIVESVDEVVDSIVVGQNWNNDVRIILFVVLKSGLMLDSKLVEKLKTNIRVSATPRHVPSVIHQITSIPHTISGKKVELAVSRILNGENVDNKEALANPESLEQFYKIKFD